MQRKQLAQGDVLLVPVAQVPVGSKPKALDKGRVILAYGEVTGHAHRVVGPDGQDAPDGVALLEAPDGTVYMTIDELIGGSAVVHDEHAPVELTPGAYRVVHQREYSPEEIRNVED